MSRYVDKDMVMNDHMTRRMIEVTMPHTKPPPGNKLSGGSVSMHPFT